MSKISAFTYLTLDGVMQGPGRPDEDRRDGFEYGGWAPPYQDEVMGTASAEGMAETEALLFGRRTYEDFYGFWPNQTEPNPFTDVLNTMRKYVVSNSLEEPLPWSNSTLLKGDAAESVASLREQPGGDIVILGSGELVRSLMRHSLIDQYTLLIHPLSLGVGRRLFPDDASAANFKLIDTLTTTTGVIMATYQPVNPAERTSD